MNRPISYLVFTLLLAPAALGAAAPKAAGAQGFFDTENDRSPLYRIGRHSAGLFVDYPILAGAGSGALTYALVQSDVDAKVRMQLVRKPFLSYGVSRTVFTAGHFTPLAAPVFLYSRGLAGGGPEDFKKAAVTAQAVALSAAYVSLFKFATGRRAPHRTDNPASFQPVRLEINPHDPRLFWPSGHTASIFTMVAAWHAVEPGNLWIPIAGYPIAAFTGFAMVDGNYHWLSDAVSGAIIGWTVGWYIGRAYYSKPRRFFWEVGPTEVRFGLRID